MRRASKVTGQGLGWFLSAGIFSAGIYGFAGSPTPKVTFADVEPIMKAHCVRCHAAGQAAAGLALDSASGARKAATPGNAAASVLMQRILGQGGKPQMPMGFTALSGREIAVVRAWIDQGCLAPAKSANTHWAYVKPVRPALPQVVHRRWVRSPIDVFVLSRLENEKLLPSPEADRVTLIRRVTLDLTGLPPSPREVDAFLADHSPGAYEKVVDRLLASPHYGERMALPWLDAARYADSNGFQMDGDTYQYVWRDWVVRAMNANMPFDRFTTEQIAGDLLPDAVLATPEGRDKIIASAFNRNHMLNGEGGAIPEEQRSVGLFDRVDTTCTTWLGLTMACARCHDHKYDPLTQRDYYGMMAFFNNVPESGVPDGGVPYSIAKPWIYAGTQQQMDRMAALESQSAAAALAVKQMEDSLETKEAQAAWEKAADPKLPKEILDLLHIDRAKRSPEQVGKVRAYFLDHGLSGPPAEMRNRYLTMLKELDALRGSVPRVMVMSDRQPRETHVLSRGNYDAPLEKVEPTTPAALPAMPKEAPKNRVALAKWVVSADNPLTARVQVNRYWQLFFGKGLVRTPENFGVQGEPPTHPELLDWLAVEFRESKWNVKRLQRMIVTSATYRQSSKATPSSRKRDPDNRFLARGARFRLPAMLLRDGALYASGLIDLTLGGKPVYPYQPKGIWDGLAITDERDFTYPQSKGHDLYRRSIYSFWRRTVAPGNMFDASSRQVCTVRQGQTSTPLHALTTLNDTTWVEAGRALAQRVMTESSSPDTRLIEAFRRVCARRPDADELLVLRRSLNRALQAFKTDPKAADSYLAQGASPKATQFPPIEQAAYATVCLAILNLDEALTRE